MIESLIQWIENLSGLIPLPLFVIVGSFLEEIVAPIPSPLVMTSAGTMIQVSGQGFFYAVFIAALASTVKTLASLVLYIFSDKVEDFFINKFGKILKISHKDTEGIGKHFNNTRRDDILLFILRAVPLFPNAPISIFCGIIKLNLKTYIWSTFTGTLIKNLVYIYAGVLSLNYLEKFREGYPIIENLGYLLLIGTIVYFIYKHQKSKNILKKCIKMFFKFFEK